MDYAELVNQILTAERGAKAMAEEAQERRQQLQKSLDREIDAMRQDYMARANHRLEEVRETEATASESAMQTMDQRLSHTMQRMEASYEKNKERWVDTLFTMIVGVKPS